MTDLTPLDIGAIEQRAAAASRGSWLLAENAEFINAALIDVPLLVAEVRRLRAQRDAALEAVNAELLAPVRYAQTHDLADAVRAALGVQPEPDKGYCVCDGQPRPDCGINAHRSQAAAAALHAAVRAADAGIQAERYESIQSTAERLGVNPRTIRRRIADGTITAHRAAGKKLIRLDVAEVDEKLLQPIPTVNGAA
jgi:excisionase family DNA binding protein